jgi:PhnB protein
MSSLTPYLCCANAAAALDFYTAAFGAIEIERWTGDDGRIGHAELDLGGSRMYLADEYPEIGVHGPSEPGRTPVSLVLEVPDVDATVTAAVDLGGVVERPIDAQPGGRRAGWLVDPFGHRWNLTSAPTGGQVPAGRVGDFEIVRPEPTSP